MTLEHKLKSKKLGFGVAFIVFSLTALYIYPHIINSIDEKNNIRIMTICREYAERVLQESEKKPVKEVAQKVAQELNIGEIKCPLCVQYEFDSTTNTAIVTGYDKSEEVVSRTSINPPSFVRYER